MTALAFSGSTLGSLTAESTMTPVTLPTGGTSPYAVSVTAGRLPAGLALDSVTGIVSGAPFAAGDYAVTFTITDAAAGSVSQAFTGTIAAQSGYGPGFADPAANHLTSVTVASRVSGHPETGRLTVAKGGFTTTYQGGDTPSVPTFEKQYLKRDKVVN